jgi:ubiquinone/menaquinone biosynthesis C-methylase UbiE
MSSEPTDAGAQWSQAFAGSNVDGMRAYDAINARLFTPFAHDLIDRLAPERGATALDVAAGPGTVAYPLAARIGPAGRVIATDVSPAMLDIARAKPTSDDAAAIEWVEAPAVPLPLPDTCVDVVTCQQGLQFFPDKTAALAEMRRTLHRGGRAGVAVWTQIDEQVYRHLHDAIASVVSAELAQRYLGPFLLSGERAAEHARDAGFDNVELTRVTLPAVLPGGAGELFDSLRAAGVAADIAALDEAQRTELRAEVQRQAAPFVVGDTLRSSLTASVLVLS